MIGDSPFEYWLTRISIFVLHFYAPACSAYTTVFACKAFLCYQLYAELPAFTVPQYWFLAETVFYVFFLWYRTHLQREAIHPPLKTSEERKTLFNNVKSEIHDAKEYLGGWFRGAKIEDIGREQLRDFLDWVFFDARAARVHEDELEEYVREIEKLVGRRFGEGRGTAKALRLTLDPIEMECRSLLWYLLIMTIDTITHIRMLWHGFEYYCTPATSIGVFPPRPAELISCSKRSPAKQISYWLRPHTSKTRLPVLFVHGIGVGLIPNIDFLHELDLALNPDRNKNDGGQVGVMAVEILQISSRLTHAILKRSDYLEQLAQILDMHHFERFVLASHSYGSVLSTYALTYEPLASRVASTLFIDPVTILLHMPDVAYNFTARPPKHAKEWQLWFIGSKDPGVAYTLGRHFFWTENILWYDRILELVEHGMNMTASLGGRDLIVNTQAVRNYLARDDVPQPMVKTDKERRMYVDCKKEDEANVAEWNTRKWRGSGLEVVWFDNLDHAQVFDTRETRVKLVNILVEYSKDASSRHSDPTQ